MTARPHETRQTDGLDQVATLVRSVPVRLVEVSRGGCRLECPVRLESGTAGLLAVELAGVLRVDDIRVARCQPRVGASPVFQVGAELLKTRRLGRRTIRLAVSRIINGERAPGYASNDGEVAYTAETTPAAVIRMSDGRAPPPTSDRGS